MTSDSEVPKGERLYVRPNKKVNEMTPEEVKAFAQSVATRFVAQVALIDAPRARREGQLGHAVADRQDLR